MTRRLPETKTLYELLPKGTEGGKEFARIVDLLRFHEARRAGRKITLFSDVAGESQEHIFDAILARHTDGEDRAVAELLGGLLLDGAETAEARAEEVLYLILRAAIHVDEAAVVRRLVSLVRASVERNPNIEQALSHAFQRLWVTSNEAERASAILIGQVVLLTECGMPVSRHLYPVDASSVLWVMCVSHAARTAEDILSYHFMRRFRNVAER